MKKTSKLLITLHYQLALIDVLHPHRQRFRFLWKQCVKNEKHRNLIYNNNNVLNASLGEVRKTNVFLFTLSTCCCFSSFEDIDGEIDDLIAYFEQELTLDSPFPEICSPELDMAQVHISG